jgi:hypothetical protein
MAIRLEKILYEKLFNNSMLGRQRVIGAARHWEYDPADKLWEKAYKEGPPLTKTTGLWRTFEPIFAWAFYHWPRDICIKRGIAMEDVLLFHDRELRRDVLFEHINRQSLHPMMHQLFKRRRTRWSKVERGLRGFFVPDTLQKEASSRLLGDTYKNIVEWQNFLAVNWWNDMTPTIHWPTTARLIPLEIVIMYGIFNNDYYQRYFYNETETELTQAEVDKIYKEKFDPKKDFDLDTEEGKREFESEVNRFNQLYPGFIAKDNEQYNFKQFYAKWAITHNKDTSRFDTKLIEDVKAKLEGDKLEKKRQITDKDVKFKKIAVGTQFPKRLLDKHHKVLL